MTQGVEPNPLARRLAAVRRRLRLVAGVRGVSLLTTTLVLSVAAAALLDWRTHLPGALRALLLVASLGAVGVVAAALVRPLRERSDDLSLALRIEARYPELNDCLASTVQFLDDPAAADRTGSAAMRRAAVRGALLKAERCDFNQIINRRGVGTASLSLLASTALGVALVLLFPGVARTALVRLADPFGSVEWPPQTRIADHTGKSRLARNDVFVVNATLDGVVPEEATVSLWFDGMQPETQKYKVEKGVLVTKDERRVFHSFRYRIQANDAMTEWREVAVMVPPSLAPAGNYPSPQVTLRFPKYTGLPDRSLPDGTATLPTDAPDTIDGAMPAGTRVVLTAVADRPLVRAWIEFREPAALKVVGALGPLGAGGLALWGQFPAEFPSNRSDPAVWGRIPADVPRNRAFKVELAPWVSGDYALCLEGESGLIGTHLMEIRVQSDPAPLVELRRPSSSSDSLAVLPDADVTLQVKATDEKYGLRSIALEYRCGKDEKPQRLSLFRHQAAAAVAPALLSALAAAPVPPPSSALRPTTTLIVSDRLSLKRLRHADGRPLRDGDSVLLTALADDFDDIALTKKPGRSHEVELRIIGLPTLEAMLNQAQAQIQQELHRQRELEREALKKVAELEKQWKNTGKLSKQDEDNLEQAKLLQQQVRSRLGNREEGLRAEVGKLQQTLRDNHLPRSGTQERLDAVAEELDRLGREELPQIEPLLTDALKEKQLAGGQPKSQPGKREPLSEALGHQEEVEKTLSDLLARLEPWSTTREVKAETRALLEEERKLEERAAKLDAETPKGAQPQTLTPEQRAELEKAADGQERLGERLNKLLDKMDRVAGEKNRSAQDRKEKARLLEEQADKKEKQADKMKARDPEVARLLQEEAQTLRREAEQLREEAEQFKAEAAALEKAAQAGRQNQARQKMQQASKEVRDNQLGKARQSQRASADALEQMGKALSDRREEELDQIIKKLRDAEKEMARLTEEQERLQKKVKEAEQIKGPIQREAALSRLSREQEKLQNDTQELTRQLSRMRSERAREALSRAAARMDEAGQELERGRDPEEKQDDALDRMEEAQRELQQAREQAEEELAREKLAKVADQLKRLKDRQEALLPETARIQRELLERKEWTRGLRSSLLDLARAQEGLAKETRSLADGKLKDVIVFSRVMGKSAEAMEQAAERLKHRKGNADMDFDGAVEEAADRDVQASQRLALQRLEQLVAALKTEPGQRAGGSKAGGGNGGGGGGKKGGGDGIPQLAQLKALKSLQEEVNQRTEEFSKKHPDTGKLAEPEKKELETIRRDQAEVADLLQQLTAPADEGGKP